ncbi:MAG: ATP-binding protein [Ramlibacter sp.]|nr:ATP-binding protein [Ramlibacter sp.]
MSAPNRRILLVDDTPSIHEDFRKVLARQPAARLDAVETSLFGRPVQPAAAGFEVSSALDGARGVAMAEAAVAAGSPFAMAFVDMRMPPGWDGVETIERLWAVDPLIQVVICTAYADHPWEEVMARLDVRDRLLVVKKPFDVVEVSQLARTLTAKWDLARQAETQIEGLARAVDEVRASEAALRQSHKELETFAHALSHDLRGPLTALGSFTQLLARELEGAAAGKALHYLTRIQANAAMAGQQIDDLLFLDGVSRTELNPEPVELGALARELMDALQLSEVGREVALTVHEGLWVYADRNLARILLRQLLVNAWKFTAGRSPGRIEVGRSTDAVGEPAFYVRDNGHGFEMMYAGKMFLVPQRLHRDSEPAGSGTGLVVVSRIVGRHGGRVWAESAPGAGATFHFTLPAASPAA